MAITRRAMLKSRMNSQGASLNSGNSSSLLEVAKMDLAKQKQKAQVVLRNNVLTPVKYVKPVRQSSGALERKPAQISKSSLGTKSQGKSASGQTISGKMKIVTPRLPWNKGKIPSRTDSGLSRSASLPKSTRPKPRQTDCGVQTTQVTVKKSASTTATNTSTKVVLRQGKEARSSLSEQTVYKRRSRSFDSLFEGRHSGIPEISPTQCFKCRKEMSKASSLSSYSKLSEDYTPFSSVSDVQDVSWWSSQDFVDKDDNNNTLQYLDEKPTKLSKNGKYVKPAFGEIVSDTECYNNRNYESDVSQADSDYAVGGVVSDTEFYARKSRVKDKRHLYLDSPIPAMIDERRSLSNASIEERKMKLENDLDSLLDSMAFALGNKKDGDDSKKGEAASGNSDDSYSPPMFFRPIFEVKI